MADKELSDLPDATDLTGAEKFHVVQGGNSREASALQLQKMVEKIGSDIASSAVLGVSDPGSYYTVTGTTGISSFADVRVGKVVTLRFAAALNLSHHATDLILLGGEDITTAAGDIGVFRQYASGDWVCLSYFKAAVSPNMFKANALRHSGEASDRHLQSIAAAWVNFTGTGTIAINDDVNVQSLTDNGTGDYAVLLTNSMANTDYAVTVSAGTFAANAEIESLAAGSFETQIKDVAQTGVLRDAPIVCAIVMGQLSS